MERKEKVFQGSPNQNQITPKTKVKFESPPRAPREQHKPRMQDFRTRIDPPRWGLTALGGVESILEPHEVRWEIFLPPPICCFFPIHPPLFPPCHWVHTTPSRRRGARTRGPTTSAATVSASPRSCVRVAARGRGDRPPPSRRRPVRTTAARRRPVSLFLGGRRVTAHPAACHVSAHPRGISAAPCLLLSLFRRRFSFFAAFPTNKGTPARTRSPGTSARSATRRT